jgi:hypothetical protein
MKDSSKLVKGQTYYINFTGLYDYCHYKGEAVYSGLTMRLEVDSEGTEAMHFGFYIPGLNYSIHPEPNWFPLDSIFVND